MRTFYTSAKGCCELIPDNFSNESTQHEWFEKNLRVLFPNLELVKRKMQISKKIPDTVAYDNAGNTFVAIEYKNKRSDTVREQAEDYLNMMKDNHDTLIVKYNDRPNIDRRSHDSFEWKKMYVMIIAPEFNDRQISNSKRKDDECLYELKKFENGIVTLRFVAGKRGPIDTVVKPPPEPEPEPTEPELTSNPNPHESKNPLLYKTLRDRMCSTFSGVKELPKKVYVGFGRDDEYLLCTAIVQKSKIKVYFGRKGDFMEDEFVKHAPTSGHPGTGNYNTNVTNESDIEKLLPILKQVNTAK